jgi:arsenate reductase (thioredoxin)
MTNQTLNVLFLCTGNSARSIMAEALLNAIGNGRFHAYSAGSNPTGTVNPFARERLTKESVPAENARSKDWNEFSQTGAPQMDFVITVCDNAAGEVCPIWPGRPITAHWGVSDPAAFDGSDDEKRLEFGRVFGVLHRRISLFTSLNTESLKQLTLEQKVRDIGQTD